VHFYLYDRQKGELVVTAGSGEAGRKMVKAGHSIPTDAERSIVASAAKLQRYVLVEDVQDDPRFLPNPLLPETRSEVAIPLLARDGLMGVLDVQDDKAGRFTASDLDTFSTLAGQIAVAIENARVFEEMQRVMDRLREVDRLKSEFLANMSHELRTPLNSIIGYAELILMGINGELDEETSKDVQAIFDNGQQLLTLINDVLDLAKIEAGRMHLELEAVPIGPLLEEVRTRNAGLLLKKPIHMSVEVEQGLPHLMADRLRLEQILNNLVSNAVKFTEEGHLWLRAFRDGDEICLQVEDTGVGIDEEGLSTIFDKFRQADGSFTRRAKGTGLGLAITRHLVDMHEGRIHVRSIPDHGSTFTVCLPTRPPAPLTQTQTQAQAQSQAFSLEQNTG
jgi:signal transduction histidine kinase